MFYKRSSFRLKIIRKFKNDQGQLLQFIGRYFLIQIKANKFILIDSTTMLKVIIKESNSSSSFAINYLSSFIISVYTPYQ